MQIRVGYFTHKGDRQSNEDALLIDKELISEYGSDALASPPNETRTIISKSFESNKALFTVADGMGGESRGEEASFLVLNQLLNEYDKLVDEKSILNTLHHAKAQLDSKAQEDSSLLNFGSTVAGVLLSGSKAIIFNSGDSRVYRLSGAFLELLSQDHSYVQSLVDEGLLRAEEVNQNPYKNILTSAIAGDLSENTPDTEIKSIEVDADETFLLCSDGVWEAMELESMEACFKQECVVECLIDRVNMSEDRDNFSVIVVEVKQ